jgi:hypothetical protein
MRRRWPRIPRRSPSRRSCNTCADTRAAEPVLATCPKPVYKCRMLHGLVCGA